MGEAAATEAELVTEALDDALALVSEHLPYATLPPTSRKLLNQATHERIAPVLHDESPDDGRACRIQGQRNTIYIEADLIVDKTPPELGQEAAQPARNGQGRPETAQAPISRGLGSHKARMAEGVGFDPPRDQTAPNGFRDRPVQPLRHPSRMLRGQRRSG